MTLDQLRYFLAAAKFQHVGKAARSVFISPSAVSGAIAALEGELGSRLFEREHRRVYLTVVGQELQARAGRILEDVASLKGRLKGEPAALKGTYRLAASTFLARRLLSEAWFALQEGHPDLVGELGAMEGADVVAEVLAGRADLGLCFNPVSHPDLEAVVLHRGCLLLAARRGHPIFRSPPARRIAGLQDYPAVLHRVGPGVDIGSRNAMFERFRIKPRVAVSWEGSDEIGIAKLRSSDCWSFMPDVVLKSCRELRVIARPSGWDAPCDIKAVRHRHRLLDRVLRALLGELRARAARLRGAAV